MRLSVTIPVMNEQDVLPELLRRVLAVLDGVAGGPHELLVVDDGSTDATRVMLEAAARADPRVRAILLSRNFGHQRAISAGLDHVTGDVVVVMDGDLQDVPEEIPRLLAAHADGFDVVYARRIGRSEPLLLRAAYAIFYRVAARFSRVRLPLDAGDFALMSRRVVDVICAAPERSRYVRGLRAWAGFRQVGIDVTRGVRAAGRSKYSLMGLTRLALDGLFAFSTVPIRAVMGLGALAMLSAILFAAYAVYVRLVQGRAPEGFTSIIFTVTFLAGVNLFFLGVVGEYIGRIYEEVKQRPLYVIERIVGGP